MLSKLIAQRPRCSQGCSDSLEKPILCHGDRAFLKSRCVSALKPEPLSPLTLTKPPEQLLTLLPDPSLIASVPVWLYLGRATHPALTQQSQFGSAVARDEVTEGAFSLGMGLSKRATPHCCCMCWERPGYALDSRTLRRAGETGTSWLLLCQAPWAAPSVSPELRA